MDNKQDLFEHGELFLEREVDNGRLLAKYDLPDDFLAKYARTGNFQSPVRLCAIDLATFTSDQSSKVTVKASNIVLPPAPDDAPVGSVCLWNWTVLADPLGCLWKRGPLWEHPKERFFYTPRRLVKVDLRKQETAPLDSNIDIEDAFWLTIGPDGTGYAFKFALGIVAISGLSPSCRQIVTDFAQVLIAAGVPLYAPLLNMIAEYAAWPSHFCLCA